MIYQRFWLSVYHRLLRLQAKNRFSMDNLVWLNQYFSLLVNIYHFINFFTLESDLLQRNKLRVFIVLFAITAQKTPRM